MEIKRDSYLNQLISFMWDGQVKVITGIRRCGKSYLLRNIFKKYLLENKTDEAHILTYELDLAKDIRYRNPLELAKAVRDFVSGKDDPYYLFIDEIQMSDEIPNPYNPDGKKITFYDALNDLKSIPNLDIYVTGSNSKMLSSDILRQVSLLDRSGDRSDDSGRAGIVALIALKNKYRADAALNGTFFCTEIVVENISTLNFVIVVIHFINLSF